MSARLDHTVVFSKDRFRGARFLAELIETPEPQAVGPFAALQLEDGPTLDYYDTDGDVTMQHLAFRVPDDLFERILAKVSERELPYWSDPVHRDPGNTYLIHGSRGFYVEDPDGHNLEFLTAPDGERDGAAS
ncbi:VOC family protein [Streptomyces sp. NPDC047315]|uniref:VOC family protein n=1 Tax=Streptomyces sp. NPDC047315 TaxID=3155142 RepID=UPI0033CEAD30